jgi:hypothetical protein
VYLWCIFLLQQAHHRSTKPSPFITTRYQIVLVEMKAAQMQKMRANGAPARLGRGRLQVLAKSYQGPPPAWNKRVVVPEVEPRDGPKVIHIDERVSMGWIGLIDGATRKRARSRAASRMRNAAGVVCVRRRQTNNAMHSPH